MADFISTLTNVGRALKNANEARSAATPITYLEIGQGRTAPTRRDTAVETPFAIPKRFANPGGRAEGDAYVLPFVDPSGDVYTAYEACWFSGGSVAAGGGTLIWRAVIPTGLNKPANAAANYIFAGAIAGEELDSVTFNVTFEGGITPDATETTKGKVELADQGEAQADSNWSNAVVLTVLRGRQLVENWWQGATVPVSKLRGTLSVANIPRGSTAGSGIVQLATAAEIRAALAGTNPAGAIENKVVSLEQLYQARASYITDNYETTTQAVFDARAVRVPGRIFFIPE